MNIYQSNTYRKDLSWLRFDNERKGQERQQVKDQQSCIIIFVAYLTVPSSNEGHQLRHDKVCHAWSNGRFIEIQNNFRRKKLHRTNQGSNFRGGSFLSIEIMQEPQSISEEKVNPNILKHNFSSRTNLSIFTSITPVLLHWSNETS